MVFSARPASKQVVGATRARQGRSGRHILWVLVFGVALTVLAFTAAYLARQGDFDGANMNNGGPTAMGTQTSAPEPAAKQVPGPEPR